MPSSHQSYRDAAIGRAKYLSEIEPELSVECPVGGEETESISGCPLRQDPAKAGIEIFQRPCLADAKTIWRVRDEPSGSLRKLDIRDGTPADVDVRFHFGARCIRFGCFDCTCVPVRCDDRRRSFFPLRFSRGIDHRLPLLHIMARPFLENESSPQSRCDSPRHHRGFDSYRS